MHKARLSLNWSCEILVYERRQIEEFQYYEEGCLYGPGITEGLIEGRN